MNTKKKIISAGHICLDITPAFKDDRERSVLEVFKPGNLVAVENAKVNLGGSVSNTGIGMKLLGADVELMGMIGEDAFGRLILNELKKYGIAPDTMIVSPSADTSYSVILAPKGIDRIMLHHAGANDEFTMEYLPFDRIKQANLFHFGYPTLMRKLYERNGQGLIRLLKAIHETGTAVSLDMALFEENTPTGRQDWYEILKKILPYVDFFVPSVEELCMMLDRERYYRWIKRAEGRDITSVLDVEKDICPLGDQLMDMGAKIILIKCGALGLYFRTAGSRLLRKIGGGIGEELSFSWANRERFETSYLAEKLKSGTGAGDTTIAAFLTAAVQGYSWEDALHLAAATGALCVQTYDALSGLLPLEEIHKKILAGWKKRDAV